MGNDLENIEQVEKERLERTSIELKQFEFLSPEQKIDAECKLQKYSYAINRAKGLDYSQSLKASLQVFAGEFSESLGRLRNLPFQVANPHDHIYNPIVRALEESDRKIRIVRFDAHHDCHLEKESITHCGNYLSNLLLDNGLAEKISEVISTHGEAQGTDKDDDVYQMFRDPTLERTMQRGEAMKINGIPIFLINIRDLQPSEQPTIIDIDLDGCETSSWRGCTGGHLYNATSEYLVRSANQDSIVLHPRVAAGILRSRVKNPIGVYVALERAYRNRLLWNRVELDFLEEIAA